MGKRALIFGVNGFVGAYLTRELDSHGYEVCGSDLKESCALAEVGRYASCDLADPEGVVKVVADAKPDYIVNLAAISSVGQSWRMPALAMRVNVEGTLNVMEAARALETMPRVLLVGSSEEYAPKDGPLNEGDPTVSNNPYGISKATQERFAALYTERYGLEVCLTRSFNHTGPGQNPNFVLPSWCKQAAAIERSGKPGRMTVGNLKVARDFSDVRDVVRAYRLILERGRAGDAYNVGSGRALPLGELLEIVTGFCNQDIEVGIDPELIRPTDTPCICCDASKLREELGWVPERNIEDTLREIYQGFLRDMTGTNRKAISLG